MFDSFVIFKVFMFRCEILQVVFLCLTLARDVSDSAHLVTTAAPTTVTEPFIPTQHTAESTEHAEQFW